MNAHNDVAVVLSGEQFEANLIAHVSAGRLMTLNREGNAETIEFHDCNTSRLEKAYTHSDQHCKDCNKFGYCYMCVSLCLSADACVSI